MAFSRNLVLLAASVLIVCVVCTAEESFTSGLASVVGGGATTEDIEWDYSDGPRGPAHWAELSPKWAACAEGTWQSPMEVKEGHIMLDGLVDSPANISYGPAPAYAHGDGKKTLEVRWAAGIFNVHAFDYTLEKLVFHTPSEHIYHGEHFPLEVQFYHTHPTEGVAVNSLVYRVGEANSWLQQITPKFDSLADDMTSTNLGLVDSSGVGKEDLGWTRYFRYLGSLSIPPCSEDPIVYWSLLESPLTASQEQIDQVAAALHHTKNNRPNQPFEIRSQHFPKFVPE